jgi:hypothetical protein
MMRLLIFISAIFLLAGCSVQQRRYQPGLHVEWRGKEQHRPAATRPRHANPPVTPAETAHHVNEELLAAADAPGSLRGREGSSRIAPSQLSRKNTLRRADPDTCDLIIMKNGDEIRAKVIEIGQENIRYNKCDVGSAVFVSYKKDVFMIRYANGSREVFNTPSSPAPSTSSNPVAQKKEHPDAVLVLILAILGWFPGVGSIPAIIIGKKALKEIQANPGMYTGKDLIQFGVVISWIKLALLLAVILFYFLLIFLFLLA